MKTPPSKLKFKDLYKWQKKIVRLYKKQDSQRVLWICDTRGGLGKSELAKFLEADLGYHKRGWPNFFLAKPGKRDGAGLALCYKGQQLVGLDCPRDNHGDGVMPYHILEQMKDGKVLIVKYKSKHIFVEGGSAKIIVFSNALPTWTRLSTRRWNTWLLSGNTGAKAILEKVVTPSCDQFTDPEIYMKEHGFMRDPNNSSQWIPN